MRIGISTASLYPTPVEEAAHLLLARGVPVAELFLNTFCELDEPLKGAVLGQIQGSAMRVSSIHPFTSPLESSLFFTSYTRRFSDGLALYRRYCEYALEAGAKILVFHGNHNRTRRPPEVYFERFARLREIGRRMGVIIAQENVYDHCSESLEFLVRMRKYLHDEVEFVLDNKQAVRSGQNPLQMAEALGERVVHLHLSDSGAGRDCLPPGEGDFDFAAYFRILKKAGYRGDGVVELYQNSFHDPKQLFDSRDRLQKIADSVFGA